MDFATVNSRTSPGRELSPDPQLPHYGPRFAPAGRLDITEITICEMSRKHFQSSHVLMRIVDRVIRCIEKKTKFVKIVNKNISGVALVLFYAQFCLKLIKIPTVQI